MEQFKFIKDKDNYSTSKGRYLKYFFDDKKLGLFQLGETDDYFYFTIMLKEEYLKDSFSLNINSVSPVYPAFDNLIKGFNHIEVMEEGTPEKKSISFKKGENQIQITFNLTGEERAFYTIELANLRRLGDTRFKTLIPITKHSDKDLYELESAFRYKFKARLHQLLNELEVVCQATKNNSTQV